MKNRIGNLINIIGWKTKRKIIVIESDDWGSVRMSSNKAIQKLTEAGHDFSKDLYSRYDSLASEEDLTALFEVLNSVKDIHGNPAMITANTIMANPNFEKITKLNYSEYYYEKFTDTLQKYPNHKKSFNLWKEGIKANLFYPQFHGREHVNVHRWLNACRSDKNQVRLACELGVFGLRSKFSNDLRNSYMRALDFENADEKEFVNKSLIEGMRLFEQIFEYTSDSFIAPSYVWSSDSEKILKKIGVNYLQGIKYQYIPKLNKIKLQKKFHYTGQINKNQQVYLVRNAFFEPTQKGLDESIKNTLNQIDIAFKFKNPVIISSHRINFIGWLNENNRKKNLVAFKTLLKEIVNRYPDVEFMSTNKLGDLIRN